MRAVTRRDFLQSVVLAAGAAELGGASAQVDPPLHLSGSRDPFTLGVASGDPWPDGFVIWTRLAPEPLAGGGMPPVPVRVRWEVAEDDRFRRIVRTGWAVSEPSSAHAVHVELRGLQSGRWYWYRFSTGPAASRVGRAQTLPSDTRRLRFAFASCQHYEFGYFTALRHLAHEDVAFVLHLGDYIYEYAAGDGPTRRHVGGEARTLSEYRNRYAQYKLDPDLQSAHAACPWIATWDDHEVADNYAGTHPAIGEPQEGFPGRRAAAYRAYLEHMPLRRAARSLPNETRLYRAFHLGQLAAFFVLDTRQYRTPQPCGDNTTWPCAGMFDPSATLLGEVQERWLMDGFRRSRARWNVIPQQVMVAAVNRRQRDRDRFTMDHWAGYEVARQRLLAGLAARPQANPVVLTGDVHSNWVNDLCRTPDGPAVATEFVGTSISSGGDGQDLPRHMESVFADNPFVRFYNEQRGYVTCEITPGRLQADYRVVEAVSVPGARVSTRAQFVVEAGRPGAQRL